VQLDVALEGDFPGALLEILLVIEAAAGGKIASVETIDERHAPVGGARCAAQ
jgi:hypothetical protein